VRCCCLHSLDDADQDECRELLGEFPFLWCQFARWLISVARRVILFWFVDPSPSSVALEVVRAVLEGVCCTIR
jgi:hypothetical protein